MIIQNTNLISPLNPVESKELGKVFDSKEILQSLSILIFTDLRKYLEQVKLTEQFHLEEFFKYNVNVGYDLFSDSSFSKGFLECRTILHIYVTCNCIAMPEIFDNRYRHTYQLCIKHRKWDCKRYKSLYPNNLGEYISLCDGILFVKRLQRDCRVQIKNFWYGKEVENLTREILTCKDKDSKYFECLQIESRRLKGISDLANKLHKYSPICYSDSKTALSWLDKGKIFSDCYKTVKSNKAIDLTVQKSLIETNHYLLQSSIGKQDFLSLSGHALAVKYKSSKMFDPHNPFPYESIPTAEFWNTKEKGEIPADFSRK